MKTKGYVALMLISLLLLSSVAMAEPSYNLSGRDKVGRFGSDGKSARATFTNTVEFEGDTSDAYTTVLKASDPSADNVIVLPDSSGTLATTAGGDVTLTDEYLFVGNSSDLAVGVAVTGDINITNAGVTTIDLADTKLFVGSGAGLATAKTLSGDATIANTGAMTLSANSVSVSQFGPTNTVTATISTANTGAEIEVEAGSILLSTELISGFSNDITLNKSTYNDPTWIVNVSAHTVNPVIVNGTFLRP